MAKMIDVIVNLIDSQAKKQLNDLENKKYKVDVDIDRGNISEATKNVKQLGSSVVSTNTTFGKLKSTISNTFSSGKIAMTSHLAVLHEINKAGKEAKETIKDIDKAITDLSIATNMSREATAGLVKEYNSYAKELKSTTTQITSAADDYLRAGKSMSEAKALIEDSIMLSKLGQLETPEATEDLLATMNGFEMSIDEVGNALDAMVAIDMKAATSAGDIATALKYSASSADMAGLSFNKLSAMIGTVQDKTQQSAETVGTFMNTLLSRYRNVKIGQFVSDDGEDLEKEKEHIQDMLDASNEYYDKLIKQQEKMWDSLIKNLEKQKSQWEELGQMKEIAEAYSAVEQVFGDLGYTVEDVLNGSTGAFEDFKAKYIAIMSDMNQNTSFQEGLEYASGVAKESFGSIVNNSKEAKDAVGNVADEMDRVNTSASNASASVSETASSVETVADNVGTLKNNISDVNTLVTDEQIAFDNLKLKIDEVITAINDKTTTIQEEQNAVGIATSSEMADFLLLKEKILEVKESLDNINDSITTLDVTPVNNLTDAFQQLYDKLLLVSTTLGVGIETSENNGVSGITSAIQALNEISLQEGIITQFENLKAAIDSVSAAIGGGGGKSSGEEGQNSGSGSAKGGKSSGGEAGDDKSKGKSSGGDSLTSAITTMGETANEVIGEPEAEGDGTVIGEFGSLKTAVNDVTSAIGGGESEESKDEENLIGAITNLGDKATEIVGSPDEEETITGRFKKMDDVLGEANAHVTGISDGLDAIDGKEVECTIKINIETNGSTSFTGAGMVLGSMNLNSAEYKVQYGNAHYEGTTKVTGDWGTREGGKTLMGELGRELVVRGSRFFTVGDNGAEFVDLQRGDIVFNHLQTKELLDKGNLVGRGKALAGGTINNPTTLPSYLRPLQEGDSEYAFMKSFEIYQDMLKTQVIPPLNAIDSNMDMVARNISNVNNRTVNNSPVVHMTVNCPGVTTNELANQVSAELNKAVNGMSLYAYQKASITR